MSLKLNQLQLLSFFFIPRASLKRAKMPKSLLVWFLSFRPRVAGNTGKLPVLTGLETSMFIYLQLTHFWLAVIVSATTWHSEGRGQVGGLHVAILIFRLTWHVWAGVTVEDLESSGRWTSIASCPKPASWPSILEDFLSSVCFVELVCLSLTAEFMLEENCVLKRVVGSVSPHMHRQVCSPTTQGLIREVETGWLVNSNSWQSFKIPVYSDQTK